MKYRAMERMFLLNVKALNPAVEKTARHGKK